jgi:hypothetical protein
VTSIFTQKQLRVKLTLLPVNGAPQTFPGTGSNTLTLTNLRMSSTTEGAANYSNTLELRIWGMLPADMNALTTLFFGPTPTQIGFSTALLESNDGTGWNQVFSGNIFNASPQYNDMPDVSMLIQAMVAYTPGIAPVSPLSYPNGASAEFVAQSIATAMGLKFVNAGVTAQVGPGAYFPGTPRDQLNALKRGLQLDYYIDNRTLTLCPLYKPGTSSATVQISPSNGLIGYPQPIVGGISFDCYFTPALQLAGLVRISGSDVPYANGLWSTRTRTHQLDALLPDGKWQTHVLGIYEASQ